MIHRFLLTFILLLTCAFMTDITSAFMINTASLIVFNDTNIIKRTRITTYHPHNYHYNTISISKNNTDKYHHQQQQQDVDYHQAADQPRGVSSGLMSEPLRSVQTKQYQTTINQQSDM